MWPRKPLYWTGRQVKLLGEGGFAKAYLVTDRDGEQWVLKQYSRLDSNTRQEIETLRALQRSGVSERCGVPEIRATALAPDWAQRSRLVPSVELEYVRGQDLLRVMRRQRLEPDEVLAIAEDLLETLACLHGAGLVHRDLKLENVIWDDRHARLIDYGFLCADDGAAGVPQCAAEGPAGTVSYAAPELYDALAQGSQSAQSALGSTSTPASDLWALGVLLWELLSNRTAAPQTRSDVESIPAQLALEQRRAEALPLLRTLRTLLQLEPARRSSAAALLRTLRR